MWPRRIVLSIGCLLLLLAAGAAAAADQPRILTGTIRWEGEMDLDRPVKVARDAVLEIAAGTVVRPRAPEAGLTVQGRLVVKGSAGKPVTFAAPQGWKGIEFVEPDGPSTIDFARFSGAEAALSSLAAHFTVRHSRFADCRSAIRLLRESDPVIEDCRFEGGELAIDNEMKSAPTIRRNLFRGQSRAGILASHNSRGRIADNRFENNKQGVALLQRYPDRISGNVFAGNEVGIYCNQTQNTPEIAGNRFEHNQNALVNVSFAFPAVRDNVFVDNETAIRNDQFGSALVSHNLFRSNGTALYNNRKSNPVVENNRFEGNDLALFCDYSSYPKVRDNNFLGNRTGVKLGIYQSADWEKRSGSRRLVQKEAAARNSKNPMLAQAPTEFEDVVDVSANWWGKDTDRLEQAGAEGNVEIFHDRRDRPTVVYEGFGPEAYALDVVRFAPWLKSPVAGAGPREVP
jgi:parallel beta-helix repeat protein